MRPRWARGTVRLRPRFRVCARGRRRPALSALRSITPRQVTRLRITGCLSERALPRGTARRFRSMAHPTLRGIRSAQLGLLVNATLAGVKLVAGLVGNSYALVADAVESTADVLASIAVWGGLAIAA